MRIPQKEQSKTARLVSESLTYIKQTKGLNVGGKHKSLEEGNATTFLTLLLFIFIEKQETQALKVRKTNTVLTSPGQRVQETTKTTSSIDTVELPY